MVSHQAHRGLKAPSSTPSFTSAILEEVVLMVFLLVRLLVAFTPSMSPFATASIALPESTIHDLHACPFGIGADEYISSLPLLSHSS